MKDQNKKLESEDVKKNNQNPKHIPLSLPRYHLGATSLWPSATDESTATLGHISILQETETKYFLTSIHFSYISQYISNWVFLNLEKTKTN